MLEKDFQRWIVDCAERFNWRVWHAAAPMRPIGGNKFVPDPRGRGLCDLIMLHDDPPRLILAEVKNEAGVLSDDQREFLRLARNVASEVRLHATVFGDSVVSPPRLIGSPIGVYVWRPGVEDLITEILRGKVLIP